jgi:transposase InsO family protein
VERPVIAAVWAIDISYFPMARGFIYLAAAIDWHNCTEAVEEAIARYGKREIFNTDQGSQFMSSKFTGLLHGHGICISMDGKAAGETTCSSNGCGARSSTRRWCATNATVRKWNGSGALPKMRAGPSKSACRSRLQTASSCVGQEPSW